MRGRLDHTACVARQCVAQCVARQQAWKISAGRNKTPLLPLYRWLQGPAMWLVAIFALLVAIFAALVANFALLVAIFVALRASQYKSLPGCCLLPPVYILLPR